MTFEDYSKQAGVTVQYGGTPRDRLTYTSIALSGEVGEYLNDYKKFLRTAFSDGGTPYGELRDRMINELGDVLWYLDRAAHELDTTLEQVAILNITKLSARYSRKEES